MKEIKLLIVHGNTEELSKMIAAAVGKIFGTCNCIEITIKAGSLDGQVFSTDNEKENIKPTVKTVCSLILEHFGANDLNGLAVILNKSQSTIRHVFNSRMIKKRFVPKLIKLAEQFGKPLPGELKKLLREVAV